MFRFSGIQQLQSYSVGRAPTQRQATVVSPVTCSILMTLPQCFREFDSRYSVRHVFKIFLRSNSIVMLIMRHVFLQLYYSILSFLLLPHALGTYLKRTLCS